MSLQELILLAVAMVSSYGLIEAANEDRDFGLINPQYPCSEGDDGKGGACNLFIRERMCDIGFRNRLLVPSVPDSIINTEERINFGFIAPFSGSDAKTETTSHMGLLCAVERVSQDDSILPGYEFNPVFGDTIGLQTTAVAASLCLQEVGVRMIVGPSFSGSAIGAATVGKIFNVPMIGTTPSSPALEARDDLYGFPTFSRIMPSDVYQGRGLALLMQKFEWRRVVTISLANDEYSEGVISAFRDEASNLQVEVVRSVTFTRETPDEDIEKMLSRIRSSGVRVILFVGYIGDSRRVLGIAKGLGMLDEGWAWIGSDSWVTDAALTDPLLGTQGIMGLVPHVEMQSEEWKNLRDCYASHREDEFGMFGNLSWVDPEPTWISAYMYDATLHLALSLESLRRNTTDSLSFVGSLPRLTPASAGPLLRHIRALTFEGATGRVELDTDGERRGMAEYDIINTHTLGIPSGNVQLVVGSVVPAMQKVEILDPAALVFPGGVGSAPKTLEAECLVDRPSEPENVLGVVLVLLGTMISGACAVFNYVWRLNKIVRVSAWRVNILTISGCFIVYLSLYAMSWDAYSMVGSCASVGSPTNFTSGTTDQEEYSSREISDVPCDLGSNECKWEGGLQVCASRLWLFGIGYTLAFGSLFAKTYRITKLFDGSAVTTKIGDNQVFVYIMVQVLPMIVFLMTWTLRFPMYIRYDASDITGEDSLVKGYMLAEMCVGEHYYEVFNIVFVFYCLAMLLLGAFLAWSVKDVWIKEVNDSSAVAMCIYTILIVGGLGYAVVLSVETRSEAYLAAVLSGWLCNTLVLVILFVPKMYEVYKRRHDDNLVLGAGPERINIHSITTPVEISKSQKLFRARSAKRVNSGSMVPPPQIDGTSQSYQSIGSLNPMFSENDRHYRKMY